MCRTLPGGECALNRGEGIDAVSLAARRLILKRIEDRPNSDQTLIQRRRRANELSRVPQILNSVLAGGSAVVRTQKASQSCGRTCGHKSSP
jgi:hypothetical protein